MCKSKYILVICKKCLISYKKREDSVKEWGGLCSSCSCKEISNRPEIRKLRSIFHKKRLLMQGGIPNANKFKKGQPRELHPNWKGGKPKCKTCHKELYSYSSKYCNEHKYILIKGENNHRWNGGVSEYPDGWKETLKRAIRERDNNKCQKCGIPQMECLEALSVHHKDENKNNLNPDNLLSLCRHCHIKLHNAKKKVRV